MSAGNERGFIAFQEEKKRLTDRLYRAFGSSTGYLFGLAPTDRAAVEAIVGVIIQYKQGCPVYVLKTDEVYKP